MDTIKYMEYNNQYLDVKCAMSNAFMIAANSDILDISYNVEERQINIQVVLITGGSVSERASNKLKNNLPEFKIRIDELFISKEKFNESKGEWTPRYYTWYKNLLFAKAEVL